MNPSSAYFFSMQSLPSLKLIPLLPISSQNEFKVSERVITMKEVLKALREDRLVEMFGTGTACVICPIGNVDYLENNYTIPTSESEDQLSKRIYKFITDLQYGRTRFKDWVHEL